MKTKMKMIFQKIVQLYGKKSVHHAELYGRGFALSLAGLIYLSISVFFSEGELLRMAYFLVFGMGMVGLYGVATLYRSLFVPETLHQKSHKQI